ncbi:glycosyl transferase group 1 [Candidatus Magnetomorum sp. HK-1]|nr:glycosyl transferase group 1 [Candidatus Magnetomorum sp. HK-1]
MILYHCPDIQMKCAGMSRLYGHVNILTKHGFDAAILHANKGFVLDDQPSVPIRYGEIQEGDIVVIPESYPGIMHEIKDYPIRRFAIALSWSYLFQTLPDNMDWRHFNIERAIVVSPFIGKLIEWSMGIPVHLIIAGLNKSLYHNENIPKKNWISFIKRKSDLVTNLKRILRARNSDYIDKIEWIALENLSEKDYAEIIRKSRVYLNVSTAEGLVSSCLKAMRCGAIIAGFDSIGGTDLLKGSGLQKNSILVQTGDYVSLAYELEPLLKDMISEQMTTWKNMILNGINTTKAFTCEAEEASLIKFWKEYL